MTTAPYLTKADIARLVDFAARYHVMIVPEIDSPGHMTAALRNHRELWQGGTNASRLDIGMDASYALMEDLLRELIPIFPGPYWHIDADEYNLGSFPHYATYAQQHFCPPGTTASNADALIGYVNWANGIVKSFGKRSLAWHDVTRVTGNTCVALDATS